MKNTLLTAALALTCAFSASAQDRAKQHEGRMKSPEARAKHHAEMMHKKLNLSEDQRARIEHIDLKTARDMKAPMEAAPAQREQMKAMHQQREAEYKNVLTQEQFAEYRKMVAERREKMQHRMAERTKDGQ